MSKDMGNTSKSIYGTNNFGNVQMVNSSGKVVTSESRLTSVSCLVGNSVIHRKLLFLEPPSQAP